MNAIILICLAVVIVSIMLCAVLDAAIKKFKGLDLRMGFSLTINGDKKL